MSSIIFCVGNSVCFQQRTYTPFRCRAPCRGLVASCGRDGELHSPNPLRTRRKGTPASRLFLSCGLGIVSARLALTLKT